MCFLYFLHHSISDIEMKYRARGEGMLSILGELHVSERVGGGVGVRRRGQRGSNNSMEGLVGHDRILYFILRE